MMTIQTQSFEIFKCIVLSVFISMVHDQNIQIFYMTSIATYFSIGFDRICKSSWDILCMTIKGSMSKITTFPATELFFSTLERKSSCNNFATKLTGMPLDACQRAIFAFLFKKTSFEFFFTCRAFSYYKTIFVSTFFRTIDFAFTRFRVFAHKFSVTNFTFIHIYH